MGQGEVLSTDRRMCPFASTGVLVLLALQPLEPSTAADVPLVAKFSQPPEGIGENIPSNIDWTDMVPNVVVADDWVSDGRPITAVRWWGSEIPPPDPKLCDQPFVCGAEPVSCDPAIPSCLCATRPDGTGNCVDAANTFCDDFGACPTGDDLECPPGTKCVTDTCCTRNPNQCFPNCGDPPPDPNGCHSPEESPFCAGAVSTACGAAGDACHCARHVADGLTTDGPGVCVDSNQFASCGALPWCGGQGDVVCESLRPGSKCVFDQCCQWRCVLNCHEAPPTKACANPAVCGEPIVSCGNDPACRCIVGGDGSGVCVDGSQLSCDLPCANDGDCPPNMKCDGGQTCCGMSVCVANCPTVALAEAQGEPSPAPAERERPFPAAPGATTAALGASGSTKIGSAQAVDASIHVATAAAPPDGWFLSFHEMPLRFDSQRAALAVYFCDAAVVQQTATLLPSCDGHPVLEYLADLNDCCLVRANPDSRSILPVLPATQEAFFEERCFDYALDIQAVVGHKFVQDPNTLECIEVPTGRTLQSDIWGWHTTTAMCGVDPFGPNPAQASWVTMGVANTWLYGPWTVADTLCSPPSMAFELLTPTPGENDFNGNCVPDTCECPLIDPPQPPAVASHAGQVKNRYLSIVPNNPGKQTALQVTLVGSTPFPAEVGKQWWVGLPEEVCENSGQGLNTVDCGPALGIPQRTMWWSPLSCNQVCLDWHSLVDRAGNPLDVLHIGDPDISSGSSYEIRAVDCSCGTTDPANFSAPLVVDTSQWGDTVGLSLAGCPASGPNGGPISLILDCTSIINKFSNLPCAPIKSRMDIDPGNPNLIIDIADVVGCLGGFTGGGFPYPAPVGCP